MISILATFLMTKTSLGPKAAKWASWGVLAVIVALLIGAALLWFNDTVDDAHDEGVKQGVTTERVEAQGKVIENVKTANETRAAVRDERSRAAYDECLRSARNPANCERFVPK